MFFTVDKGISLKILKIFICAGIIFVPIYIPAVGAESAAYLLFAAAACVFVFRLISEKRIYISPPQITLVLLGAYAVVFSPFSKSAAGNIRYIFSISACILIMSLFSDYCNANGDTGFKKRMQWFIVLSGAVLSIADIVYWYVKIMPYSPLERVSFGLGSNKMCATFCICSIAAAISLYPNLQKNIKRLAAAAIALLSTGVLLTCEKSTPMLVILLIAGAAAQKCKNNAYTIIGCVCAVVSAVFSVAIGRTPLFADIAVLLRKYSLGMGGGAEKNLVTLFQTYYYELPQNARLFEKAILYSGIFGAAATVIILFRAVVLFVKRGTYLSYFSMILTIHVVLCGDGNFSMCLFLCGLLAYNESEAKTTKNIFIKEKTLERAAAVFLLTAIISTFVFFEHMLEKKADHLFENGNGTQAFLLYKSCAAINRVNSRPCVMALKAFTKYYNDEYLGEAEALADKAINRDTYNARVYETCAKMFSKSKNYDEEIKMWRKALDTANKNDRYRLSLVKALYNKMKTETRGSENAKNLYNEILKTSDNTIDIDIKKKINDIADKAQPLDVASLEAVYAAKNKE